MFDDFLPCSSNPVRFLAQVGTNLNEWMTSNVHSPLGPSMPCVGNRRPKSPSSTCHCQALQPARRRIFRRSCIRRITRSVVNTKDVPVIIALSLAPRPPCLPRGIHSWRHPRKTAGTFEMRKLGKRRGLDHWRYPVQTSGLSWLVSGRRASSVYVAPPPLIRVANRPAPSVLE